MLSCADSAETWIRLTQWGVWTFFRYPNACLRQFDERNYDWASLFMGHLEESLPFHKRLPGPVRTLPVFRTTGDAALTRFASKGRAKNIDGSGRRKNPSAGVAPATQGRGNFSGQEKNPSSIGFDP